MKTITLKKIAVAQANELFPGSMTEDILELQEMERSEPGYHTLAVHDGRLLSWRRVRHPAGVHNCDRMTRYARTGVVHSSSNPW